MNSLHTSLPQKTPVRGVALLPQGEDNRRDAALPRSAMTTTAAIRQHRTTLFDRSMEALRKATRGKVMPHLVVLLCLLFSCAELAIAQTNFFWVGGGAGSWTDGNSWAEGNVAGPRGRFPGAGDDAYFDQVGTISVSIPNLTPTPVRRVFVQRNSNVTFGGSTGSQLLISTNANLQDRLFIESNSQLTIAGAQVRVENAAGTGAGNINNVRVAGTLVLQAPAVSAFQLLAPAGDAQMVILPSGVLRLRNANNMNANNGFERGPNTTIIYDRDAVGCGTLEYDDTGNSNVTIPTSLAATNEIPNLVGTSVVMTGNISINRIQSNGAPNGVGVITELNTPINPVKFIIQGNIILRAGVLTLGKNNANNNVTVEVGDVTAGKAGGTVVRPVGGSGTIAGLLSIAPGVVRPLTELILRTPAAQIATPALAGTTSLFFAASPFNQLHALGVNQPNTNVTVASNLYTNILNMTPITDNSTLTIDVARRFVVGDTISTYPLARASAIGTAAVQGNIVINGTMVVATNSTLTTDVGSTVNVRSTGRLVLYGAMTMAEEGGTANAGTIVGTGVVTYEVIGAARGTLEYARGSASNTGVNVRITGIEWPNLPIAMNGNVVVNGGVSATGLASVGLQNDKTIEGTLTLLQGDLRLQDAGPVARTLTIGAGGSIASTGVGTITTSDAAGIANAGALIYNSSVAGFLRLTQSPTVPNRIPSTFINKLEINGAGTLSLLSNLTLDGTGSPVTDPGRLRIITGSALSLNGYRLGFTGGAVEGGWIDVEPGYLGTLNGNISSRIYYASAKQSAMRLGAGSLSQLQEIDIDQTLNASAQPVLTLQNSCEFLITLRLGNAGGTNGGILRVGTGATLTTRDPIIQPAVLNANNFYVDLTGGGRLSQENVISRTFPVGVTYNNGAAATDFQYAPVGVSLIGGVMPGETFTVGLGTTTGAGPTFLYPFGGTVQEGVRLQWLVNRSAYSGANASNPTQISFQWNGAYPIPEATAMFSANRLNGSMRRWTGSGFIAVPSPALAGGTVAGSFTTNVTAPVSGTYLLANTNVPFNFAADPFDFYWVGNANTNWNDANNWSFASGGTGGVGVPGINDRVIFDRAQVPVITTGIPASIQRLVIKDNAAPTFAQTNRELVLIQNPAATPAPEQENLYIGPGSSLTLSRVGGAGTGGTRLRVQNGGAFVGTTVFGTLRLNEGGTFHSEAATGFITIANGGVLQMSGGVFENSSTAPNNINYQTQPPYTMAASGANGTLRYVFSTGATLKPTGNMPIVPTGANNKEWGTANGVLPNLEVNVTGPIPEFYVDLGAAAVNISSSATLIAGKWRMDRGSNMGQTIAIGDGALVNQGTLDVRPGTTLVGHPGSELVINGPGRANVRFTENPINSRTLTRLQIDNPLAQVWLQSGRELVLANAAAPPALNMIRANPSFGLVIPAADTVRLGDGAVATVYTGAITATGGRAQVDGMFTIHNASALTVAAAGGFVIGTNGTLNIRTDGAAVASGMVQTNGPAYLARTSRLQYTGDANIAVGNGASLEFPDNFGASLLVNKFNLAPMAAWPFGTQATVTLNASKVMTGATVTLRNGYLSILGRTLAFQGASLITDGGLIQAEPTAGTGGASIVYQSSTPAFLYLTNPAYGATHPVYGGGGNPQTEGRFLNKLEINSSVPLTLATNSTLTIDGIAGAPVNPPAPYIQVPPPVAPAVAADNNGGQLRLDQAAGSLVLNGSSLTLSGTGLNLSGQVVTSSTGGSIIGDVAGLNTAVLFRTRRPSTLKLGGSVAQQSLRNLEVNSASGPVVNPLVTMITPGTVSNTFTLGNQPEVNGGGVLRLEAAATPLELNVTGTTAATMRASMTNNFVDVSAGGRMTMPIAAGGVKMFPVATTDANVFTPTVRFAPVMITHSGAANDIYSVGAKSVLDADKQPNVYPNRVNVQWNISRTGTNPVSNKLSFGWTQDHELNAFTANRTIAFVAQWSGSAYNNLGATQGGFNTGLLPSTENGPNYTAVNTVLATTFNASQPFIVTAPPTAITLVPDPMNVNGRTTLNGGNPTITSNIPFPITLTSFNGLNNPTTALGLHDIYVDIAPAAGGTATFATVGLGSFATPINAMDFLNANTPNFQALWLNPGRATSTSATIRFYSIVGGAVRLTSAAYPVTVLAPPLLPAVLAMSQTENSSTGTQGLNGGGLGQFNVTGGVAFPIDFGFYSHTNFLAQTTATTSITASIAPHPSNPLATFALTSGTDVVMVANSQRGGRINPIVSFTGPLMPPNGVGVALLTLTASSGLGTPDLLSTTVTIFVGTNATVPTRLGYSVNSGSSLNPALSTLGVNNGNYTQTVSNPIFSTIPFPVNFASFAENGMVVRPAAPTQVQLSLQNTGGGLFSLTDNGPVTIASTNGIASLRPRITWINPSATPGYADAKLILSVVSGSTLISTEVTISIFTTGTVASRIVMSQTSTTGTEGVNGRAMSSAAGGTLLPIPISSGVPFFIDYAFYNPWGFPASGYPANGSFTITRTIITPLGPGEDITVDGNSNLFLPSAVTAGRYPGIVLNWRGRTAASPSTVDVNLTLNAGFSGILPDGFGYGSITTVTIRLSSSANVPVFLGLSQVSSTSSVGVNNGNAILSGQPFNVDAGLFDINGAFTPSQQNVGANLTVSTPPGSSGSFSISGNTSGVFVNQAGIRYNNVVITWQNPTATPTRVRLTISTTAGPGPIQSTFADIVISSGDVFPRVSNLSPSSGGPGTVVQITGVNFTGVNAVSFNGVPAAGFTVSGDGLIIATAPAGVSTGLVTVSRPAFGSIPAGSGQSATPFTVGLQPVITSFSPTAGGIGSRIIIRGANLLGASSIRLADVTAVLDPEPSNSSTNGTFISVILTGPLTVVGSLDASRSGPVTMATLNGVVVSSAFFTYNPAPVITSITPSSAVVNGQDIPIIIRGRNFNLPLMPNPLIALESQSGVYFSISNSPQAISPALKMSLQSVSPTEIRATIAGTLNNMAGQRFVYVQNADGQFTTIPFQLTPAAAPVITSITPNSTTASGVAYTAIITGANFFGQAGTTVTGTGVIGGVSGQTVNLLFRAISANQLNIVIPESLNSAGQTINIRVQNSDGQFATTSISVGDPGRPFITRLTPPRAVVGSSSITVSIIGGNFFLNALVSLGNNDLQVLSRSTSNIIAVIPASLLTTFGNPTITVRNGFNGSSISAFFPIGYAAPTISSVVTASGPNPGQTVTSATIFPFQLAINGTGIRVGVTVTFNGASVQVISTSPTQVVVAIPSGLNGTPGVFPVVVQNADGQRAEGLFTIGTPNGPIITGITPATEIASGLPFTLTVDGRNFSVSPQGQPLAGTQVLFNGQALAILQASPTRLVALVPAGLNTREGQALVRVVNSDLQSFQAEMTILCAQCPIIRSFTPTNVRPTNTYGHDVTFTFSGSNFRQGSIVTIGGVALRVTNVSDSVITAVAAPGFFFGDGQIVVTNPDGRRFTVPQPGLALSARDVVASPMTGRAYPNPVEDMLTFETDITSPTLLRVRISDLLGRTVTSFEQRVGAGRFMHQLDVSGLPTGVYVFEMTDGNRRFTEKMIKR